MAVKKLAPLLMIAPLMVPIRLAVPEFWVRPPLMVEPARPWIAPALRIGPVVAVRVPSLVICAPAPLLMSVPLRVRPAETTMPAPAAVELLVIRPRLV